MVQPFLVALAIALVAAAVQPMIGGSYKRVPAFATLAVAMVCLFLATIWGSLPTPAPGSARAGVVTAANDFRWWFGIVAAIWLYQVVMNILSEIRRNNEIVSLRNDVQAITGVIHRTLMPRHLTRMQQSAMVSFLRQFEPFRVSLRVQSGDSEADGYRADFHQTFMKAGWTVSVDPSSDVQEGLRINFTQTMSDSQRPHDVKNPKPDSILYMALGTAGIRVDGSGGGSGVNITESVLRIEIGRHRHDSYVVDPPEGYV